MTRRGSSALLAVAVLTSLAVLPLMGGPSSAAPRPSPAAATSDPSQQPTGQPSGSPTDVPGSTEQPTGEPGESDSPSPTSSDGPSGTPSETPTEEPTDEPTEAPTEEPTDEIVAPKAEAVGTPGYLTIHKEAVSEDVDQPFGFTVNPSAGGTTSFNLNDNTSIAANLNVEDVGLSQDDANGTLWATQLGSGAVFYRPAGASAWQRAGGTGTRVAGGPQAASAFVMSASGVTYVNGGATTSLGKPGTCTPVDVASNGPLVLLSCAGGALYQFTGSLDGSTTTWAPVTGAPNTVDVAIATTNTVIVSNATGISTFVLDPVAHTAGSIVGRGSFSNVNDVAIDPNGGTLYSIRGNLVYRNTGGGAAWSSEAQTRQTIRMTAGTNGRAWAVDRRGVSMSTNLGATIFSRNSDGSWYDDERVKPGSAGNTVHLPVAAGSYTVRESTTANWNNQAINCTGGRTTVDVGGDRPGTATIAVAAGEHVTCTFVNVYTPSATAVTSTCQGRYVDTFGTGRAGAVQALPSGLTSYHYNSAGPGAGTNDGYYAVITRGQDAGSFGPAGLFDHTTGDGTGNFLFVNASYQPGVFYAREFTNAVVGTPYSFEAYLTSLTDLSLKPNVTLRVVDAVTGEVLNSYNTGQVTQYREWLRYGFSFRPTTSNFILQLVNNASGGQGNDIGIDDISFGISCTPVTLSKALDQPRYEDSDQFTMQIRSGSPTGPVIGTTAGSTTEGTGDTVADGSGTTSYTGPINVPVFLTETAAGSTDFGNYGKRTITCRDPNGVQGGLPTNEPFTGSVRINPVYGADIRCTLTNTADTPALELTKSASPETVSAPGEQIEYSFEVTNTGNVPVTGLELTDELDDPAGELDGPIECPVTRLDVGASTTCTATYTVTADDIDHGQVHNVATASGTAPNGDDVTSPEDDATVEVEQSSVLELTKSAEPGTVSAVGDEIEYTFEVTNNGNVTIRNLVIADVQEAPAGDLDADPVCEATTLRPGASTTCTATYTVTQADLDHGDIENVATATGTAPNGSDVTSPEDDATVEVEQSPELSLEKSAEPTKVSAVGDEITYTFAVTNTGNVTITDLAIDDEQEAPAGDLDAAPVCDPDEVAPGESTTCTATYTVTADDIDHGQVHNVATASGTAPKGDDVTSPEDDATVEVEQSSVLELTKSAEPGTVSAVGDEIEYTFEVTNNGNVTIRNLVIDDEQQEPAGDLDADPVCETTTLRPGASTTCTATYTVTQADLDHGDIENVATATGTAPNGSDVTSPEDDATVEVEQSPALTLTKTAEPDVVTQVGDTITYTFEVSNDGNVTITDLAIDDVQQEPAGDLDAAPECEETTLAPGESTTCTATYTVTRDDLEHGDVTDTATATGTAPSGDPVTSNESTWTVPTEAPYSYEATKTADPATGSDVEPQDTVTYTLEITNTGEVTMRPEITDDLSDVLDDARYSHDAEATFGEVDYERPTITWSGSIEPGETLTITYSVTVKKWARQGDHQLRNQLVVHAPGGDCAVGDEDSDALCSTTHEVTEPGGPTDPTSPPTTDPTGSPTATPSGTPTPSATPTTPSSNPGLPDTGGPNRLWLAAGLAAVLLGGVLAFVGWRRRKA